MAGPPKVTDRRRPARTRFGQHFLDTAWAAKVVRCIDAAPGQTLVEIGPGRGALTLPLLSAGARLVAFEIDRDLASALEQRRTASLHVVQGDFLGVTVESMREALALGSVPPGPIRVVGNLPYNVASPMLVKLGDLYRGGLPFEDATVMLQRDVADRVLASPGGREYGVLTVLVQRVADVTRRLDLPAGAFRPRPKVQSSLVQLRFHPPAPPVLDEAIFAALTQAIFTQRRKTLANALRAYHTTTDVSPRAALTRAAIDPRRRPETLQLAELARLADVYTLRPPNSP